MGVSANEHILESTNSTVEYLYSITCDDYIKSNAMVTVFEELEGEISDITFKVMLGDEEITIGYYGILKPYENVLQILEEEISAVNEIYATKFGYALTSSDVSVYSAADINNVIVDEITFKATNIPSVIKNNYEYTAVVTNNQLDTISSTNDDLLFTNHHNSNCDDSPTSPHEGDGNSRFVEGYGWQPDVIQVDFKNNFSEGQNRVGVYYKYYIDTENLNNLQHDDDEGLEVQVVFYNYGSDDTAGESYINMYFVNEEPVVWTSNQPTAYLDTLFGNFDELPFCVGVEDANELTAGNFYYWTIRNTAGTDEGRTYDGAFKVSVDRTYYYEDFLTVWGSLVDGLLDSATWRRFTEEHEGAIFPNVSQNASNNWATQSAWEYAASHTEWEYNTKDNDPIGVIS